MSASGRLVIVGGGPAGRACAAALRERGDERPVTILAAEPHPPYERPPLTKEYMRGEVDRDGLLIAPLGWYADNDVELMLGAKIRSLDIGARRLLCADGREWSYESCLIATGSRPAVPPIQGLESDRVRGMRTIEDSERVVGLAEAGAELIVVGSGFIGCEAASSASARGARVRLVTDEAAPQLARLGEAAAERIAAWLEADGVELVAGNGLSGFAEGGGRLVARLADGHELAADAALLGLGISRNVELAEQAGLEVDGGILVDERMRTSATGVLAAGDVARARNSSAGRSLLVEHWGEALAHGGVAAATLAGRQDTWDSVPGFWSMIGGRTLKYAGWGEGFEQVRLAERGEGWAVFYGDGERLVGVLSHCSDTDYEHGREAIAAGQPWQ